MKLRFVVASTHARTNGDIEALADAMRALKNGNDNSIRFDNRHSYEEAEKIL